MELAELVAVHQYDVGLFRHAKVALQLHLAPCAVYGDISHRHTVLDLSKYPIIHHHQVALADPYRVKCWRNFDRFPGELRYGIRPPPAQLAVVVAISVDQFDTKWLHGRFHPAVVADSP